MKFDKLNEQEIPKVAIIFGRFNPPHKGHKGAWEKAAQYEHWYVGTNPSTQGAKGKSGKAGENKDPLPYELKVAAMEAIMPEIKGHIIPESTWWSLATAVYNKHGKVHLVVISDPEDGAGFVKGLLNSNGKEGRHGYYNFAEITHDAAPRASSATALRAAVANDDRDAFAQAAGVDPEFKVQGRDFFDLVSHYLVGKEMKESSLGKIVREGYFSQSVDKVAKDWEHRRRTGKWPDETDEKNPLSHDKDDVYVGDKDLAGRQIITYLNDKGKKVTGSVAKRSTNSPKGYFLDTGEFVSQQRVIAKESLGESDDDDGPFYALVLLGAHSKKRKLKFRNQEAFEKWADAQEGDYELLGFQDIDESYIYNPDDDGLERELGRPESNRPATLADLDVEEGDKIEFYYSKHTPRMPATVTGFEDGKVVVTIDNGKAFRLNWTHEAVLAETLDEDSDPMNPTVGNYDLDTLQRKVARDFAQMAETAANAKSRREWNNIMHQLSNNTMYQLEDILDTYETLQARYSKGGANSRGIDKSRLESTSTLGKITQEGCGSKHKGKKK